MFVLSVPKLKELDATFGVLTETWLSDGHELESNVDDLSSGAGLGLLALNRPRNDMGFSHGGVALIFCKTQCSAKRIVLPNPENFEVLAVMINFTGQSKKVAVLACYLPPTYTPARGRAALDYIRDAVTHIKRTYNSPYVIVSGDFNQWKLESALEDFPDMLEAPVGPTRGSRAIDRNFTNFGHLVKKAHTIAPLQADDPSQGRPSDHRVAVLGIELPKVEAYRWLKYSYRYYNEDSVALFEDWVVL